MSGRTRVAFHAALATLFAAAALGAVFDGYGWIVPVTGGILVVAIVSELVRWSPVPSALGPIVASAGGTCYITWVYSSEPAYGGIIPSRASLQVLADTARDGFDDIRDLATPVPTHDGLVLLAVVGLMAIALVVDLFAVTMRRAALAGIPLLAVFALCTSVAKNGAGWIPFVIGTTGYLWLLLADSRARLARWGRPLGFDRDTRPHFNWSDSEVTPSPLSVMGRRIGVTAIAIAVVVPLAIPGLRGGVPHGGGSGFGFGGGSSEAVTVNPIVTIRAQLSADVAENVLVLSTTDSQPGYLRLTALDQFDGQSFAPSTLEAPADAQVSRGFSPPVVQGTSQHTDISILGLAVHWLPLPTQAVAVQVSGDWRYEREANTVFSARSDTRGLSYAVESVKPDLNRASLETATSADPSVQSYLDLPDISSPVRALTTQVTRNAKTPFDKAVAIQRYLTGPPFVYDLAVAGSDSDSPLDEFLLRSHRGFCQQYATAMAVMARLEGIPSRIAVGFTRGDQQPDGRWVVTTRDAHAWPELYFSGFGWVPFEPTPRGDGQAVQPDYTAAPLPGPTNQPDSTANGGKGKNGKTQQPKTKNERFDDLADLATANGPAGDGGTAAPEHSGRTILLWVLLGLAGVALVAPSVARVVSRRRRWSRAVTPAERATAAWAELRASAIDARAGWIDGLTPRGTARVLRAEASGLATAEVRALDRIVDAVQRAWYAPAGGWVATPDLEDDVESIRTALLSDATVAERFVLRAWPRSSLRSTREVTARIGDVLDAIDLGLARIRARVSLRGA